MILLSIIVASAVAMLFGCAVGAALAREEREALWEAIEEWADADAALPKFGHGQRHEYQRLERAEAELRAIAAIDAVEAEFRRQFTADPER